MIDEGLLVLPSLSLGIAGNAIGKSDVKEDREQVPDVMMSSMDVMTSSINFICQQLAESLKEGLVFILEQEARTASCNDFYFLIREEFSEFIFPERIL